MRSKSIGKKFFILIVWGNHNSRAKFYDGPFQIRLKLTVDSDVWCPLGI